MLFSLNVLKKACWFTAMALVVTACISNNKRTPHAGSATEVQQWHTLTLNFSGPDTSERALDNPFLNYRLYVDFTHKDKNIRLRGYYAADGKAEKTGANTGNVWQVKFTPPMKGKWTYQATLEKGKDIALGNDDGEQIDITNAQGSFDVISSDKIGPDFRANGRLAIKDTFFYFPEIDRYWLKGGTNSPENFLAYYAFDGTYRVEPYIRNEKVVVDFELHKYLAHTQDWKAGDPTFKAGTGKSIFGAINYLADKGMNSSYFLVNNITGDGKDVWPYISHSDFTRFDVSKLAQWEQLFQHMQIRGILLHMVTQETENETMLDGGDVGPMRTLYYQELIARFGHHLGLVWNLGEENGYAEWSPPPQNTQQRKAMIDFFTENDPYNHPILLHTHAEPTTRDPVLNPLLGYPGLDGLSFQAHDRETAAATLAEWKQKSIDAGNPWLVSMDEIGMWHTGATTDSIDPWHPTLRGNVLWGSLLSGSAGVEWYFGAHQPHNDAASEDWRQRDQLWTLTNIALEFFDTHLPWWSMEPASDLVSLKGAFCLAERGKTYAVYQPQDASSLSLDLSQDSTTYDVFWYNPRTGGELAIGSLTQVKGGAAVSLGEPPKDQHMDWVILLKRTAVN